MRKPLLLCTLLFWGFSANAADVLSVFDDSSFRVGLTLPFVVQSVKDSSTGQIHRITVQDSFGTGNCLAKPDPKIPANFVLKCENVATIQLKILIGLSGELSEITYGPIQIKELKAGYREPSSGGGSATDPDIAAGRAVLFSKAQTAATGGRTCVGCHTSPGKYPIIMSATSGVLQRISENPSMSGVPNLTPTEADRVSKYLRTISDPGAWP